MKHFLLVLLLLLVPNLYAQTSSNECGTESADSVHITSLPWYGDPDYLNNFVNAIESGTYVPYSALTRVNSAIFQVPVKAWVYRTNSEAHITEQEVEQYINRVNEVYKQNNVSIRLYLLCPISYIVSDRYYLDGHPDMFQQYRTQNALNVHFVREDEDNGRGALPWRENRYACYINTEGQYTSARGVTLAHEIGHCLGLYHTFECVENSKKNGQVGNCRQESVSRTRTQGIGCRDLGKLKCSVNGDLLCDTEADPGLEDADVNFQTCQYKGTWGNDNWGEAWQPPVANVMTYGNLGCRFQFSRQQRGVMYYFLRYHQFSTQPFPRQSNPDTFFTNLMVDDFENDNYIQNAQQIVVNIPQNRSFHQTSSGLCDIDHAYFYVGQTGNYTIQTLPPPSGSTAIDTRLTLYSADDGRYLQLAQNDNASGLLSRISLSLSPGNYYLKIENISSSTSGLYNLSVVFEGDGNCDFASPRRVGTWNGLEVQIRQYGDKRVLVLLASGTATDKHYPRGDNFWDSFTKDSGVDGLRACLNGGNTGWGGMACPDNLPTPSGYVRGQEADGAVFFERAGGSSCNYSLSASVSNPNPGCAAQVTLNGGCSGDCSGLYYRWSGNGIDQSGPNATIIVPSTNGSYTYTFSATRSGCSKSVTTQLTVSGCGGTPPPSGITAGNCYRIRPLSNTANALGVSGSQTVVQQAANGQNSQLWKAEDVGGGQFRFVTQNGSGQAMRVASDNFGEAVRLAAAGSDYLQKWSVSPSGSDYRVSLGSGSTWDMRSAGGEPDLQLWGTTGNDPAPYRTFRFETATCPGGTPPPPPPTGGTYNGHFDMASCSSLLGWVWNSSAPSTRLTVEVVEGGNVVATGTANRYRQDLQQAGIGDGQYAFDIPTPASLKNNQPRTISVRVQGTGYILNNSPRTITCPAGARIAAPHSAETAGEWRLMPNPAGDEVTLEAPYGLTERSMVVKLTGMNGVEYVVSRRHQQVAGRRLRLNLREQSLPAGLYIVEIREEGKPVAKLKLVKQ